MLDRIEQGFDWSAFEALLSPIHGSAMGAPGYPPLTMFKILLLQQWRTLSDPAAEEAVRNHLSSAAFAACRWTWRRPITPRSGGFARTIDKLGLSAALLVEVNRQLDARGFVIKRGTLVDATLMAGAVSGVRGRRRRSARPGRAFHAQARQDLFRLQGASGGGRGKRARAPAEMTSANVHDSRLGEALIQGDEQGYFADRAYDSQALRQTSSVTA